MGRFLSVKELDRKDRERAEINHQTYKHIYELCTNQVRRQHSTGNTCTIFTVPTFVVGRTPFTHAHAIGYIVTKLERGGFRVTEDRDSFPGVLLIDWGRHPSEKEDPKPKTRETKPPSTTKKTREKKVPPRTKIKEPLKVRLARLQSRAIMNA